KGREVRSPRLSPPSARRGSRRSRGGMALRDKEPSPRSRCARSLRSALRREREETCAALGFHPLRHEGGRDEVAGGWRCGTKNHPLGRAARVRFAPPFGAEGEETCAALGFHTLRRERGKRRAQPSAFTPPSAGRGRDDVAGGWRCGTKNHPLGRAARVRFALPFGAEGEETCAALGFHTPFRRKGVATKSREDGVAGQRTIPSVALRAFASLRPSARKGKETCAALGFHPLRHEGGRDEVAGGWRCVTKVSLHPPLIGPNAPFVAAC